MSAWIDANRQPKPAKGRKVSAAGTRASTAKGKKAGTKTPRTGKSSSAVARVAQPDDARTGPQTGIPLRIPYGNKEVALQLGARYAAGGWYAPPPFGASKTLLYMAHPKWPKTPSDPLGERTDVIRRRNLTP